MFSTVSICLMCFVSILYYKSKNYYCMNCAKFRKSINTKRRIKVNSNLTTGALLLLSFYIILVLGFGCVYISHNVDISMHTFVSWFFFFFTHLFMLLKILQKTLFFRIICPLKITCRIKSPYKYRVYQV